MENLTKLSFGFTDDDIALLNKLKEVLKPIYGVQSNVSVVRIALRVLERQQ
jgi:hypothetical protein